ncbi:OX2G protein, partial [Cephalopterus ornatus]|nr:OX2G protein [Cephalopterus ornatus]
VVPHAEEIQVRVGDNAPLSCALTEPMDVVQVTWQKGSEKSQKNIATYSKLKGLNIHKSYQDRMNFTSLELNKTSITFWNTTMDDSGCYLCLFNTFPSGSISGRICLNVFGLNASVHYNVSEGHLTAVCSAVGFPEPTITWNNVFDSAPAQEVVSHTNGVVSITSTLQVHNPQRIRAPGLVCRVNNTNETRELPVKINGEEGPSLLWLVIIAVIVLVVAVVCLLFWRKKICRR